MQPDIHQRTVSKVIGRLILFMVGMYFLNVPNRVDIGLAAGILFASYVAFEVPSNLIMPRIDTFIVMALGRRGIGRREAALIQRKIAGK